MNTVNYSDIVVDKDCFQYDDFKMKYLNNEYLVRLCYIIRGDSITLIRLKVNHPGTVT